MMRSGTCPRPKAKPLASTSAKGVADFLYLLVARVTRGDNPRVVLDPDRLRPVGGRVHSVHDGATLAAPFDLH
jgi:hypothetical protein